MFNRPMADGADPQTERDAELEETLALTPVERNHEKSTIQRARNGDQAAFEKLYRENVGRVFALCFRLEGDEGRSEELTQDVFVRAWTKLGTFRGESAFSTWLHRLAVNVIFESKRSRGRRAEKETASNESITMAPDMTPRSTDAHLDLEMAIRSLPDGARSIFVLHDVEGYKHHEIASFLGVTTGASKSQLHRARKLLREAMLS